MRRCKSKEYLTSPMFPKPGEKIYGDWRVCQINDKGAIIRIGARYFTKEVAQHYAGNSGNYIVKRIVCTK